MLNALYTVAVLELFLGGSGRLIEIGPGTLRMVLFVPCLLIGVFALFACRRISRGQLLALWLVLAYLTVHLVGLINGALHARDALDMLTELQQSLYWLAAPFFALILQSRRMVLRSAAFVQFAGVTLGIAYLGVLLGSLLGVIDFVALYDRLVATGEFIGRGENLFVYKGFLYLGIAIVFLVARRGRYWRVLTLIVTTALVLTLTRGFLLATAFAVLVMLLLQGRKATLVLGLLLVLAAGFVIWGYLPSQASQEGTESRYEVSNNQRIVDTDYVAQHLRPMTFVLGEGFGALINDRTLIENTFLWVFWNLGLVGVLFWLSPLVLCTYYFRRVPWDESHRLAGAYYFGTVLVYVQTLTNPYLNNPIGLSFVMVALFSLQTLAQGRAAARTSSASADVPGALRAVPG